MTSTKYNMSITLEGSLTPVCSQLLHPNSRQPLVYFLSLQVYLLKSHINRIYRCAWLLSLNIMLLRFNLVLHVSIFILFIAKNYPIVWLFHSLFINSVDGHLGCFQFGAIMNKASMNISVDFFEWI